jgi:hypothetical protein
LRRQRMQSEAWQRSGLSSDWRHLPLEVGDDSTSIDHFGVRSGTCWDGVSADMRQFRRERLGVVGQ